MAMAFDVFDRDRRAFMAVVDTNGSDGPVEWKADLWDSGRMIDTIKGTCVSKEDVMAHVAAVVSEHSFASDEP